jgi:hypothetical protein
MARKAKEETPTTSAQLPEDFDIIESGKWLFPVRYVDPTRTAYRQLAADGRGIPEVFPVEKRQAAVAFLAAAALRAQREERGRALAAAADQRDLQPNPDPESPVAASEEPPPRPARRRKAAPRAPEQELVAQAPKRVTERVAAQAVETVAPPELELELEPASGSVLDTDHLQQPGLFGGVFAIAKRIAKRRR